MPGAAAVITFIQVGRSIPCQREAKSGQTVTVACKPSGRAEGQVAGAVGGAWTWPVQPAAAPAPGKPHRTLYRIAYDVV